MSTEEIATLWALCAAASAGPWEADEDGCIDTAAGGMVAFAAPYANDRTVIARGENFSHADAAFIAASRAAVPTLLAERDQLRAQLDNCEDSRRELCDLAEAAQERAASAEARASAAERDARDLARVVERLTAEKAGLLAQMARIGRA